MSKQPTIASLVRDATRSERHFLSTLQQVLTDPEPERTQEYFTRLNIPRTDPTPEELGDEEAAPVGEVSGDLPIKTEGWREEEVISEGLDKFIERHIRKLKWHVAHPEVVHIPAAIRIYKSIVILSEVRLRRVISILSHKELLTPEEWGLARGLINRGFRDFRSTVHVLVTQWVDALASMGNKDELAIALSELPTMITENRGAFNRLQKDLEEIRKNLSVKPNNYPPVKPPRYFGGDVLEESAWKHYQGELNLLLETLRGHAGH